jgi:hypothetical protein
MLATTVATTAWAQDPAVTAAIARLVENRQLAEEYVLEVKRKFKPDDPVFYEARKLYLTAHGKHNAWITTVKMAIQRGKTKKLDQDRAYRAIAEEAQEANKAFIGYIESRREIAKRRAVPITEIAGMGLDVWKGISDKRQRARAEEAARFEGEVKWRHWTEVEPGK